MHDVSEKMSSVERGEKVLSLGEKCHSNLQGRQRWRISRKGSIKIFSDKYNLCHKTWMKREVSDCVGQIEPKTGGLIAGKLYGYFGVGFLFLFLIFGMKR